MKKFKVEGREVKAYEYGGKIWLSFDAQSTSFAIQGRWTNHTLTMPVSDFSEVSATALIKSKMDEKYYAWRQKTTKEF